MRTNPIFIAVLAIACIVTLAREKASAQTDKEHVSMDFEKYSVKAGSSFVISMPKDAASNIEELEYGYFKIKVVVYYDPMHPLWIVSNDRRLLKDTILLAMPFTRKDISYKTKKWWECKKTMTKYLQKNVINDNQGFAVMKVPDPVIVLMKEKAAAAKKLKEKSEKKDTPPIVPKKKQPAKKKRENKDEW